MLTRRKSREISTSLTEPSGLKEHHMNPEIIAALKEQFEALDATHMSAEEAIAQSILRDLDGYVSDSGWFNADGKLLANALVAFAQILQDHGVKA
jgi:hypothetical protein